VSKQNSWSPSKEDVEKLCEAILDGYIVEDHHSCDHCVYCDERYGNVRSKYHSQGKKEPHKSFCPVLIAQDVMTGIG
jgi:hypothetical protein